MNLTFGNSTCIFFPHIDMKTLSSTDSFYYVSKVVATITCLSSPVSAVGNALVLMGILTTPSLHNPANILIAALALSDFVIGAVVQPMYVAGTVKVDLFLDCIFRDYSLSIGIISASCSVSLMAAVSCERCIALFYPLRYPTIATNKRALFVAALIVLFWITLVLILSKVEMIGALLGIVAWCFSCFVITFSYIKVFLLVRRHRRQIQIQQAAVQANQAAGNVQNVNTLTASQMKLAITMGYIIGFSLLFYVPTEIVFGISLFKKPSEALFNGESLALAIHMTSSSLNPLFCCTRMPELRQAVRKKLSKLCHV